MQKSKNNKSIIKFLSRVLPRWAKCMNFVLEYEQTKPTLNQVTSIIITSIIMLEMETQKYSFNAKRLESTNRKSPQTIKECMWTDHSSDLFTSSVSKRGEKKKVPATLQTLFSSDTSTAWKICWQKDSRFQGPQ